MCDGLGCFRAHHMHCHAPIITPTQAQEEDDWFCPLCTTLGKFVADVQSEFTGDEWYSEDAGSVASWDCVNDVFPEAPIQYEMAMNWKNNKIDDPTKAYLKDFFGDDDDDHHHHYVVDDNDNQHDSDEEEEDDDFDPTKKADGDDDNSDASSKATLGDLSIELNIGRKELAALSGGESSSDDDDDASKKQNKTRRSRRMRGSYAAASRTNTDDEKSASITSADVGKFDESNIVLGKRRRRKIDYAVLNDSMFGKLSAKDRKDIDDEVEFEYKAPKKRRDTTSSESDDSDGEESSVDNNDNDDDDNEGSTSKEETSECGETKNRPVQKRRKTKKG